MIFSYLLNMQSHPSWVCGLKPMMRMASSAAFLSHPSWVCGLKPEDNGSNYLDWESHPSWVCGLKLATVYSDRYP